MISSGLKHHYAPVRGAGPDLGNGDPPDVKSLPPTPSSPGRAFWAWIDTIWPLVLHCVGAIGIAILLINYVDNNHFNIVERRPATTLTDGTVIRTSRFSPLQSDVTTILSVALVVLRWVAAAWAGPLCWRILLFILETTGLRRRDIEWLIGYGFFPPSAYFRHTCIFAAAMLTINLCAQSASPILTGSITWAPSTIPSGVQSNSSINVSTASNDSMSSWLIYDQPYVQTRVAVRAAGFSTQAWGRDVEKSVLKRVLPSATGLNINSTIANVTLPYFRVTSLEWILDPHAHNLTWYAMRAGMSWDEINQFNSNLGTLIVLPDTWRTPGCGRYYSSCALPSPETISETRTLIINAGLLNSWSIKEQATGCEKQRAISHRFPPNMSFDLGGINCYAFARVTYSAGAGECTNCRVSSPSTVQNDSEISLQPDPMTREALWMMSNVTTNLVLLNTSIPLPWDDVDSYVVEVLTRSYSTTWSAFHELMTGPDSPRLISRVYPTLPSLQAQIDLRRVHVWLALQLLVTFSGIVFLGLQSRAKYALIGQTTMFAFDLDSTDAPKGDELDQSKAKSLLRIKPKDDGWKVVVEPQYPSKCL